MADNQPKTDMINMASIKLGGVIDIGQVYLDVINDTVFADPSTGSNESEKVACMVYPNALKRAIREIKPKFARRYADLGPEIRITEDGATGTLFKRGDWELMFDVPSNYIGLISQISEGDKKAKYEAIEITAHSWAHVVKGTDDQSYYCTADIAEAAATHKPISGATYASFFALFNTDDSYGADFETGRAYKKSQASHSGNLILAKQVSNHDGDSAYIEYLAYSPTGVGDIPTYYDDHFIAAFTTLLASEMAPVTTESNARWKLQQEYKRMCLPKAVAMDASPDYEQPEPSWLGARRI